MPSLHLHSGLRSSKSGFLLFFRHNLPRCCMGAEAWAGTWEEWAAQEPLNAHSHLCAMLTGNSESVPVVDGALQLGTWQSVLLVEMDGPRQRSVGLQFTGLTASS